MLAFAMMLAMPLAGADVALAGKLVNGLIGLRKDQNKFVCKGGEEQEECCGVDGGPGHGCQKD